MVFKKNLITPRCRQHRGNSKEEKMEIKFVKKEVEEILKKHVAGFLPDYAKDKTITVTERYGDFAVSFNEPAVPGEEKI